jgi:outer membrane protein TolC
MLPAALALLLAASFSQTAAPNRPPLRLTLKTAIAIATEDNARVRIASELAQQADTRVSQARAALLPNIDGQVSQSNQTRNLEAVGLGINSPFPAFVGPFTVFDARATGTQTIFDLSTLRRYQASKAARGAARSDVDVAAEEAAAAVARAYIAALRADAELEAVGANITLAEAILQQAQDLKAAGTGTGMEVTRAQVQLANERQRRIVVENERRRARLQLLRTMDLSLDTEIALDDDLEYRTVDPQTLSLAMKRAVAERPDFRAQVERESTAQLAASAAKLERVPALGFFGDYGTIGTSVSNAFVTRTYGLALRIPVFDGGRRDARRAEAESQHRAEQVRTMDLAKEIALDVQTALDSLRSADEEVQVAREGLGLAEAQLEQARRRYVAGVAPSLEVTQAQTELARARDNVVSALFHHAHARIDLGEATGTVRREIQ